MHTHDMPMRTVTVYADYVCPYCLLAERVLSQAIRNRDIKIEWRAFELRPAPVPTLKPEDPYLPSVWERSVYPLAKKLGVAIKLPSASPQPRTTLAFELLALAQDNGLDDAFSLQVMRSFFQEDQDIGSPELLIALAAKVGLDAHEARHVLTSRVYEQRHRDTQRYAREVLQISSVPTIIVGNQTFAGVPPMDSLQRAIDDLIAGDARASPSLSPSR